ncbi:MAG: permease-like cell division protein FtsX [Eubacteriales bacterium]|nr:permease-like cell division protein FtsX [Clostridiales bacterium]MDY3286598.1 permease-like cell division protein FtsX [Eubacteriales bacterium]
MSNRHNFTYFMKEGVRGIFTHGFMSFASVSVITTCLVLTGTVVLLMLTLTGTITDLGSSGDIRAYVDETLSDEESEALENTLRAIPNVSGVDYIDRDRGLADLREDLGEDSALLDGLEYDNPLRNCYRIWVVSIDDYAGTVEAVENTGGIAEVYASIDAMTQLQNLRNILGYASLVFVIMLGMVSIFLISNTIKLATFDRREEIGIMKMIGATDGFIRAPFFIESLILSLIAAALAFGLQWLIGNAILDSGLASLSFMKIADFRDYILPYAGAFSGTAILIGVCGSLLSIRKFLRV